MHEHVQVPRFSPPGIGEPARFRLLHHAHVVVTSGDSYRLNQATNGQGVKPLK
jgi:DNA replication protein DnaC